MEKEEKNSIEAELEIITKRLLNMKKNLLKPFKGNPKSENNEIWKKISYDIQKEKLDKAYYLGLLTAEELCQLLKELKEKIFKPKENGG